MNDLSLRPKPTRSRWDLGNLAFLLIVVAGYATMFGAAGNLFTWWSAAGAILLGLIYTFNGMIWWDRIVEAQARERLAYFVVQTLLGGLIVWISLGSAWLILLPLASHALVTMPMPVALAYYIILLIAEVLPYLQADKWQSVAAAAISHAAGLFFVGLFTQISLNENRARNEVERLAGELGKANEKLREYAFQVEELATVQERNRLAREIHDGLGHYLTGVNIQIKAAQAILDQDPARAREAMGKAQTLSEEALADVRRSVAALRQQPTENQPLPALLAGLVEECRSTGIAAFLEVEGAVRRLPPQAEMTLYRAAQEGLTNVRKHSRAASVTVLLAYRDGHSLLRVQDDGIGVEEPNGGFGLMGLRERAQLLGGRFEVASAPGQGFRLEMEIPV